MTHHRETGAVRFGLAQDGHRPTAFEAAFNTPHAALVAQIYEDPEPPGGELGTPTTVRLRHAHVAGEIALLTVDWARDDPDGSADGDAPIRGTATGVARRTEDGFWRYRVEAPFS